MKKLLVSVLFFGSFGVAMAQAQSPLSSTGLWQTFRGIVFRNVAPVMPVVMPNATKAVTAVADAVKAVGDQRYCRNQAPVSTSYCNAGKKEWLGGNGTRCSQLPGCIGTTDNEMNQCRPAPECESNKPFTATARPSGNATCKVNPNPHPYPDCYKEMAVGGLTEDYIVRCMRLMKDMVWRAPSYGTATQTFSISVTGGKSPIKINGSVGSEITLTLPLISPYHSAGGFINVTDSSNPAKSFPVSVSIACPVEQKPRCKGVDNEKQCRANDCYWTSGPGPSTNESIYYCSETPYRSVSGE